MNLKALCLVAAVLLVAACEQKPVDQGAQGGTGTGAAGQMADVEKARTALQQVGDRIFFAFDRSDITAESRATLQKQAQLLQQYPSLTITIQGHCDERGTVEYNLGLGDRRANAARQASKRIASSLIPPGPGVSKESRTRVLKHYGQN